MNPSPKIIAFNKIKKPKHQWNQFEL